MVKYPHFFKLAALFEPPPQMLARLKKEIAEYFAGLVLFVHRRNRRKLFEKDPKLVEESNDVIRECYKYTFQEIDPIKQSIKVILLRWNLDGWKYLNEGQAKKANEMMQKGLLNNAVQVKLEVFPVYSLLGYGEMDHVNNILHIYFKFHKSIHTVEDFNNHLFALWSTAEHELIHASQFMLADIFGKDPFQKPFGMPTKKPTDPEYSYFGQSAKYPGDPFKDQPHQLRDIEFYTNLKDSIDFFKFNLKNETDSNIKKQFFKLWVDEPNKYIQMKYKKIYEDDNELKPKILSPQAPFVYLKEHAPEKYQKAVKLFYTEVSHLLS